MTTRMDKAKTLRDLHTRGGTFIIANAWDAGSARLLTAAGFPALATTGAGFAFSCGRPDESLGRDAILANAAAIVEATDLPVSADLEHGFGDSPEVVAATIKQAIDLGLAGGSIEDANRSDSEPIYDIARAADRIRAAVETIRSQPVPFQLVARAENFLYGRPDLADTIRRLQAYQEAGADVLYAPGLKSAEEIRAIVNNVDRPVNVVVGLVGNALSVAELAALGVTRISVGSALARLAYGALIEAAGEMAEKGTFTFASRAIPFAKINAAFAT